MPQLPDPEPGYAWARLEGGPLDGEVILAPVEAHRRNLPADLIGVLAPVLDEAAETLEWKPVTYVFPSRQPIPPRPGDVWVYVPAQRPLS
jgi:hypothetical protein